MLTGKCECSASVFPRRARGAGAGNCARGGLYNINLDPDEGEFAGSFSKLVAVKNKYCHHPVCCICRVRVFRWVAAANSMDALHWSWWFQKDHEVFNVSFVSSVCRFLRQST